MALAGAERSAWKLHRTIANTWAQSRGALLILNLLLYFICPVSAVAALPRHDFRGPSYSNSTIVRLPKWHTSYIANSSLSTWGNTITSGSRQLTMYPVDTAQGRPSSSQFQGFILASHRPHNITTLPSSANVTYRRDSTTSTSPSPGRYVKLGDQEATATPHSTNMSANTPHCRNSTTSMPPSPSRLPSSANMTYCRNGTTSISPSPNRYLKLSNRETTTTHRSTNITSLSTALSINYTLVNHEAGSSYHSVRNIYSPSFLSRNTTRTNYDITTADVSYARTSSLSPGSSSFTLPSSSSSRSHSSRTPLQTSSYPKISGPSSSSSRTRFTLPPASSSTAPSWSSSASITPKPSTTQTPAVTSGSSSSTNKLPFSLPPGCKLTAFGNETYVLIPTERARKVHQQPNSSLGPSPSTTSQAGAAGYDHDPSPSTTSQAGAAGYDQSVKNPKEQDPFDKKVIDHSPSSKTASIILGTVLGIVPTFMAFPIMWYEISRWRLEKDEREGKIRKGAKNPAEEAQEMYNTVKKGKWTKRLASWIKDVGAWNHKPKSNPPIWPTGAQRLIQKIQKYEVSLHWRRLL